MDPKSVAKPDSILAGQLRHGLTAAGVYYATRKGIDQQWVPMAVGLIMAAGASAWSWFSKTQLKVLIMTALKLNPASTREDLDEAVKTKAVIKSLS